MNLYQVQTIKLKFYVLAEHPTQAQDIVKHELNKSDYGFSCDRKVNNITLLSKQLERNYQGNLNFSSGNNLMFTNIIQEPLKEE